MISKEQKVSRSAFEAGTGWKLEPQGACKGDVCIPLPKGALADPGEQQVDLPTVAAAMGLPLAHDAEHGLWALGPESIGGRALTSAAAPDFELPDLHGNLFRLSSLRGKKVVVYAWAPY
jgi:hypothetical protein